MSPTEVWAYDQRSGLCSGTRNNSKLNSPLCGKIKMVKRIAMKISRCLRADIRKA